MLERPDPDEFQQRLWNMFNYQIAQKLTLSQIDRIRVYLFPEIRIGLLQLTQGVALVFVCPLQIRPAKTH